MKRSIPVVVLAGYLGAGKTTLLNHLLRQPDNRLGVIINDFGDINLDAGLVSGQIDEPASIAGGCLCCLPDAGGLSDALAKLAKPQLRLDAIIVEASGIADPVALARLIRSDPTPGTRPGGIVDVVDVGEYFGTVDQGGEPPVRFAAASFVVLNKIDRLADRDREATLAAISARITERNPDAYVVPAIRSRIDPSLLLDAQRDPSAGPHSRRSGRAAVQPELPWRDVDPSHHHDHAQAVTVWTDGPADPARVADLLDHPPARAYRVKGELAIRDGRGVRRYRLNIVGRQVHLEPVPAARSGPRPGSTRSTLVAIGIGLETEVVRRRLEEALVSLSTDPRPAGWQSAESRSHQAPTATRQASGSGIDRLERYVRLSDGDILSG